MSQMKVFVSHSSADNQFGIALAQKLRNRGADVWYDESSLMPGPLTSAIAEALTDYPVFIVVLSKDAFASNFVYQECFLASHLYNEEQYRVILPITARPISFEDFKGRWLFLEPFKRIEAPGYQPLPQEEAFERVAHELFPDGECELPPGATAEELTARGKAYCFQKKFDCSVRFLKRATEIRPNYFSAWHNLAWALFEGERYEEACPVCEHALTLSANNSYAWAVYAYILQALDRPSDALVATERALTLNPGYGRVWSTKGWLLYHAGRYDEAQDTFERALSARRKDPSGDAENGLAVCLSQRGRIDEAIAICDELLGRKPLVAVNWHNKGRVLADAHRYEEALAAYNHALSLDPKLAATWKRKAEVLRALGREAEARHATKQAQQLQS